MAPVRLLNEQRDAHQRIASWRRPDAALPLYEARASNLRAAIRDAGYAQPQISRVRGETGHEEDITACNLLCGREHGFDRGSELREAIDAKTARVVEQMGRITGYAGDIAFFAHAVAETNQGLEALIGAAPAFPGPGFLLPTRNHEMFEWGLDRGLRLVMQTTLMTIGLYNEPVGAYHRYCIEILAGTERFPCRATR